MAERRKRKQSQSSSSSEQMDSSQISETESSGPSAVSMKSDQSMMMPLNFGLAKEQSSQISGIESSGPSSVSMKSDSSKFDPPDFGPEKPQSQSSCCSVCNKLSRDPVRFICGHLSCKGCVDSDLCPKCGKKLKETSGDNSLLKAKENLKKDMKKKFSVTSEGNGDRETSLESIYTNLYITSTDSKGPHGEHEYRHLKGHLTKQESQDSSVDLGDIFKPLSSKEKPQRTVLMMGVAGIGKSFAVQKFSLDWAKEETNQHVGFVFSLAFRELNLTKGEKSFHELLTEFHAALQPLKDSEVYVKTKTIVILDGLDESRLHLDFKNMKTVRSLRDRTSVANLLVNLIQGNLLPEANIWITSRPAAASQIPAECINMVTEIRGFTDAQKAEYFTRRFSDDSGLARRVTSHIQSSQSLDIMCQIPIFCWMSGVLFQEVFGGEEESKLPQTLTEMMAHFLFVQTKRRSRKYDKTTEKQREFLLKRHREFLLKLGKLAFVHLQENKLIFYEDDLSDCGVDVEEASVYSGFFNTVLREERIFAQKKIFFFVHLTIQEFFAALYVYECFTTKKTKELRNFLNLEDRDYSLLELVKLTVDKVLEKKYGHLDFFLQFLLGLMVEPNHRILQGLLAPLDPKEETDKKILTFLRSIRRKALSPDNCINIFRTMVEMGDHRVKDEIQEYLHQSGRSKTELTPLHCSALAYSLQVSKDRLETLDLKSYNTTDEGRRRLIPAVRSSIKAVLKDCKVTENWVQELAFGLTFSFSPLRDLDLSNNDLGDSGVKLLCDGLSNQSCKLQILRLSGCLVTEKGCKDLVSALESNPSHLKELDLRYNHPGESGMKQLSDLKEQPPYQLTTLNFEKCGSDRLRPGLKKYAHELTLDSNTAHRNLRLSDGNRKVTWVTEEQQYPDNAERFDQCLQVLCVRGFTERCYFEVEVVEPFSIGLTFKSLGRKGNVADCRLGQSERSWCFTSSDEGCFVLHNNQSNVVTCLRFTRVGVYLDWEAGSISFYRGSHDSHTHIYTYKTETFSEALYPAVLLHPHTSASICWPT